MEKPANSTLINVCIIPDERVSAEHAAMSQALASDQTLFSLGGERFAHMTAFMARFANDKVQGVVEAVEQALRSAKPLRLEHMGYLMTEGRYIETSYRRTADLMGLHEVLISALADLRINPGNPFEEGYFTPYTAEQQKNARETGYDLARNLYRPHITLTRYKEGGVPEIFPAMPAVNLSFDLDKVCVYKADDNGAVYELVREFRVG